MEPNASTPSLGKNPERHWDDANFAPRTCVEVVNAAAKGDFVDVRKLWSLLEASMNLIWEGDYVQSVYAACELIGYGVGSPRKPLRALPAERLAVQDRSSWHPGFPVARRQPRYVAPQRCLRSSLCETSDTTEFASNGTDGESNAFAISARKESTAWGRALPARPSLTRTDRASSAFSQAEPGVGVCPISRLSKSAARSP